MTKTFKEAHAAWQAAEAHVTTLDVNGCPDAVMSEATDARDNAAWSVVMAEPPKTEGETAQLAMFISYVHAQFKWAGGTSNGLEDAALNKLVCHLCERGA